MAAYDSARAARKDQRLREARRQFVQCAQPECPELVRRECVLGVRESDTALPTVSLRARDAEGHDLTDVLVFVDGELLTEHLSGKALPVDPGPHRFRLESRGRESVTTDEMLVVEGEKSRVITVTFPAEQTRASLGAPPAPSIATAPESRSGTPTPYRFVRNAAFVAGGVGLLTAAVTGGVVLAEAPDIERSCSNRVCPPEHHDDLDTASTFATVSTVAFVATATFLTVGIVAAVLLGSESQKRSDVACNRMLDVCLRP